MDVAVACERAGEGWRCGVQVGADPGATTHEVRLSLDAARRFGVIDGDPSELVRQSFRFLLEREPRESILRSFELELIGRYFPDWEQQVQQRLGRG